MQYSFSAEPRAVTVRPKYREHDDTIKANIMFDRRVVRGNTYSSQWAEDSRQENNETLPKRKRRVARARSPPSIFDVQPQLTQHVAIPLDQYLIEQKEKPHEVEVQTQTAKFYLRPKPKE